MIVQAPDYSQPIPAPTVEQTVIAYPPAPDQEKIKAGDPLPTSAPPAPAEDETASAAEKTFDAAREAFKAGKYAEAQKLVEDAIQKLPSDATLHEFRSLTQFAQGKYKDAAAGLYAVLAAGPGWNWRRCRSSTATLPSTPSAPCPRGFVKKNPDEGHGTSTAYQYLVLGSKDDAVKQLKETVRLQPEDKLAAGLLKALTSSEGNGAGAKPSPGK